MIYQAEFSCLKNLKIITAKYFSADGCDELFGGQQIYKKSFTSKNFNFKINNSPYTKLNSPEIKFNHSIINRKNLS